ncbi:DUF742 domain-containing protein [Saccharopolyspora gloriosae]|uniref:DUF742 domain-containing protein n=1 Tax=Saccharopolyspora gloriosae TaxID=455344 RepID=A0A840N9T0_9PSEU|nr:DUF742 domain-containing protein [Saccharopolyspora gloriosae]MBB5068374.1 hypothetical protein [Saccharopolyspora gloriosae]
MTAPDSDAWYDDDAGRMVRSYALTGGRTPDAALNLDRATQVVATLADSGRGAAETPEHEAILQRCGAPQSIAELSASLKLPLGVIRVLCSDLLEHGSLARSRMVQPRDRDILEAVLAGLNRL